MAESAQGLWQAGRAAGYRWAADEATRAYFHPLTLDPADRTKLVIEHARQAFGGRCVDQPHAWVRGFVQGAADFWQERGAQGSVSVAADSPGP